MSQNGLTFGLLMTNTVKCTSIQPQSAQLVCHQTQCTADSERERHAALRSNCTLVEGSAWRVLFACLLFIALKLVYQLRLKKDVVVKSVRKCSEINNGRERVVSLSLVGHLWLRWVYLLRNSRFLSSLWCVFILTNTNIKNTAADAVSFLSLYVTLVSAKCPKMWTYTFQTAPDPVLSHRGAEGRNKRSLPAPQCAGGRELPSGLISRSSQLEALREFAPSSEPAIW